MNKTDKGKIIQATAMIVSITCGLIVLVYLLTR